MAAELPIKNYDGSVGYGKYSDDYIGWMTMTISMLMVMIVHCTSAMSMSRAAGGDSTLVYFIAKNVEPCAM